MKKYSSLGDLLVDFRHENKMSQSDLALEFDVDVRTIIRWEKNETLLKPEKEEQMVDVTFIPYQVIRNLNAPVVIPTFYDFDIRKYSLSTLFIDLPDADWLLAKSSMTTSRVRTIKYDSDINDIIRSAMVQKHILKPIDKSLIIKATALLPSLNIIIFDKSGYYSGHCIFFPLSMHTYNKIRDRTLKEEELSTADLINYKEESNPVFYLYDLTADCNANVFHITGILMKFFKSYKGNYLYASLTSRYDSYKLNEQIGTTIVWEDKDLQKKINSKAPPRLYEGDFKMFFRNKK